MLAVTFLVSFLSVCAFYAYVFVQLERERKKLDAHKKHLPEHLYEMERETEVSADDERDAPERRSRASIPARDRASRSARRETLIQVSIAVGGLVALFAGIEVLNSLVTRLHWY